MTPLILASLLTGSQPTASSDLNGPVAAAPLSTARLGEISHVQQRLPKKSWYGWQILLADGAGLTSTIALAYAGSERGAQIAAFSMLFGGPIVHWINGNIGRGFGSLGLRLGVPSVGFAGGLLAGVLLTGNPYGAIAFAVLGYLVGGSAAIAIDAAALAWSQPVAAPSHTSRWSFSPTAWTSQAGTTQYGLVGSF